MKHTDIINNRQAFRALPSISGMALKRVAGAVNKQPEVAA
jgi:hypothetical protein